MPEGLIWRVSSNCAPSLTSKPQCPPRAEERGLPVLVVGLPVLVPLRGAVLGTYIVPPSGRSMPSWRARRERGTLPKSSRTVIVPKGRQRGVRSGSQGVHLQRTAGDWLGHLTGHKPTTNATACPRCHSSFCLSPPEARSRERTSRLWKRCFHTHSLHKGSKTEDRIPQTWTCLRLSMLTSP